MAAKGTVNLGPMSLPDAGLLVEMVQSEIEAMVQGGTFHENPERLEQLAGLQTTLLEVIPEEA
jgi:hypothetical protein